MAVKFLIFLIVVYVCIIGVCLYFVTLCLQAGVYPTQFYIMAFAVVIFILYIVKLTRDIKKEKLLLEDKSKEKEEETETEGEPSEKE